MSSVADIVKELYGPDTRNLALSLLHKLGVRTVQDISMIIDRYPKETRERLGRPIPSSVWKPLVEHKLVYGYVPGKSSRAASAYLSEEEHFQAEATGKLLSDVLNRVSLGSVEGQLTTMLPKIDEKRFGLFQAAAEYKKVLEQIGALVPKSFAMMETELEPEELEGSAVTFCFYNSTGMLMWIMRAAHLESHDRVAIGGLMFQMEELFRQQESRDFAYGAVLVTDFIWIFKFVPYKLWPVSCLYQLLDKGGIQSLAKLMCLPESVHGL